jgi:choline-glycine betaine transporter
MRYSSLLSHVRLLVIYGHFSDLRKRKEKKNKKRKRRASEHPKEKEKEKRRKKQVELGASEIP